MNRIPLPDEITATRVIAIARRVPTERLIVVADLLSSAGLTVLEITLDSEDALGSIERLAHGSMLVGAGTVRTPEHVARAREAGARFIVSPHTSAAVIDAAAEHGLPVMAGAMTPTEAVAAWDLGVSAVKLFPASVGGPEFLRSLTGPLGDVAFIPTGGVDASNARHYLAAGAVAVGVGGWLTGLEDLDSTRARAQALAGIIRPG